MNFRSTFILSLALIAGLGVLGYFISQVILNGRIGVNTATVKGLAEQMVEADSAHWQIRFSSGVRRKGTPELERLYSGAEAKRDAVLAVLRDIGFSDAELEVTPFQYSTNDHYDNDRVYTDTSHIVSGAVSLTTTQLDMVEPAYFAVSELPRQGLSVRFDAPSYRFTGLNDIKPDMLRVATENARIAADEFAKNAGVTVGGIQVATQGGFSVRDVGDARSETKSRQKIVRVVTTITFYLRN